MKKNVIKLFFVSMLFVLIPEVSAATVIHDVKGPSTAIPGEEIKITVNLDTDYMIPEYGVSEGLMFTSGKLIYDSAKVTYINHQLLFPHSHDELLQSRLTNPGEYLYVHWYQNSGRISKLAEITFKINDNVPVNTTLSFKTELDLQSAAPPVRIRKDNPDANDYPPGEIPSQAYYYDYSPYNGDTINGDTLNIQVVNATTTTKATTTKQTTTKPKTTTKKNTTTTSKKKSTNKDLKSLVVANFDLDQDFDKETLTYNITVPYESNKLEIDAVTDDSKATVEIIGNENLKVGNNEVQIKVTAEDGSNQIYNLNVEKLAEDKKDITEKANPKDSKSKTKLVIIITSSAVIGCGAIYAVIKFMKKNK